MAGQGPGPGLRRRCVLVMALAAPVLATGCGKGFGALGTPPKPRPDVGVLTGAMHAERIMIARYEAVLARSPSLAATLGPLLTEHRAHLAVLSARLVPGATRPAPPASAPPASAPHVAVPAAEGPAVAYLAAAEDAAAAGLLRHLALASPSLAQLLASIAASEATHAAALAGPGTPGHPRSAG